MSDTLMPRKMAIVAIWHNLIDIWIDLSQLEKLVKQIEMTLKLELV